VKNFPQVTNLNRNKIFDDNADYADKPEHLRKDFIIENGMAQGIDLSLKYDYRRLYIWAVYSLAYIDRYDGLQEYQPHYDRRHNVNFVGAYTLGKDLNWEINARWNFGTGFPFTQSQGYYGKIPFTGGVNTDYTTFNEWLGVLYGELNKGRLPTYHRLDFTVKRLFELGKDRTLEAVVSVTNVYDRDNVFYFDRISNERVDQLPVMPSAGLTFSF
ncbi:MAG: TonB-dependent receptor, partial [Bacteroidales bacterium]|nr:TonB-dependent receptor [Bacteroidales bacterium]